MSNHSQSAYSLKAGGKLPASLLEGLTNLTDPKMNYVPEKSHVPRNIREFFTSLAETGDPKSVDPVINGASHRDKSFIRRLLASIATQIPRLGQNVALIASLLDTSILDGGLVDDRKYDMEKIVQLAASLPTDSSALDDLSGQFLKILWERLQHPPLSYSGDQFRYRTADGSYNNILYPQIGRAGSPYARTVAPKTLQPGILPDPGVVFDALYARGKTARQHPNKISSFLFHFAAIIIHDIFHTDSHNHNRVKTSSYLDLAPLYGSSQVEQDAVRHFKDGLLKPDTFSERRILGFPPGVGAILVCFNRYHNYIATQLKIINEGNRFDTPANTSEEEALLKLDNDLFQTARLINCGLYVNIILYDYVRTILNLVRTQSTWTLDPRESFSNIFDKSGIPSGVGNQVSVEFNLVYRWHSAMSEKDERWTTDFYRQLFPGVQDLSSITERQLFEALAVWGQEQGDDPSKWLLDNGQYRRNGRGQFKDSDLANILADATDDVSCAFGARNVPVIMKLIETLGIKQARAWKVATLNEFRKFFKLQPHKTFADITQDKSVANSLEALYQHPDYVELYPGLVAEDAKDMIAPGSGLCPGFTTSVAILSDATALVRGDRFYTIDYTPANLTNWGYNQVKSDPDVAGGGVVYNLLMRALPAYYRGNSIYAMYPMIIPEENRAILTKLEVVDDYIFTRPELKPAPTPIRTWDGVTSTLYDRGKFRVPWGEHIFYLTGHDYMLGGDKDSDLEQRQHVRHALYDPSGEMTQIRKFYESLTTQLVISRSEQLRDDWFQLDACRDVFNPSHAIFAAQLFSIPLKAPDDLNLFAVEIDQLYLIMAVLFAYVFLDLDTARSQKLRLGAKKATEGLAKLVKLVCIAVQAGRLTYLNSILEDLGSAGKILKDYGIGMIDRMFKGGKSVDEVVATIMPTAAAAVATQAQHATQMLNVYLSEPYQHHWPDIQQCARSKDPADFEKLKMYALEANRLSPAAYGLLRRANQATDIQDGEKVIHVAKDEDVYGDFTTAGRDPKRFPNPDEINIKRDKRLYVHHGWGSHACLGRPIVETAMAAQLRVFAKLKNLRRAPGPQGEVKSTMPKPSIVSSDPLVPPGNITLFLKEDWSDWWPFPTTLKVHHDGFEELETEAIETDVGVPDLEEDVLKSPMMSSGRNSPSGINGLSSETELTLQTDAGGFLLPK